MAGIVSVQEKYMKMALRLARKALDLGEVPIGCVIVYEGKVIGRGYNRRNTDKNTLSHAEITAINKASKKMGDWRLEGCTLYVTLEPCQMCAGAIIQARIPEVVMGCMNQGRMRRLRAEHPGNAPVQPSGRRHQGSAGDGMQRSPKRILRRTAPPQQTGKGEQSRRNYFFRNTDLGCLHTGQT